MEQTPNLKSSMPLLIYVSITFPCLFVMSVKLYSKSNHCHNKLYPA